VLAQSGWTLRDLDGVAFGAGPGTFTGVRLACGIAQGLAFGADLPVASVPTLEGLAQTAWRRDPSAIRIFACMDARMREVYVAAYERDGDGWHATLAPTVVRPADVRLPDGDWQGVGDGFALYPELAGRPHLCATDARIVPDARAIGDLGLSQLAAGRAVAAELAQPLYVRHRVALTTAERNAGQRL